MKFQFCVKCSFNFFDIEYVINSDAHVDSQVLIILQGRWDDKLAVPFVKNYNFALSFITSTWTLSLAITPVLHADTGSTLTGVLGVTAPCHSEVCGVTLSSGTPPGIIMYGPLMLTKQHGLARCWTGGQEVLLGDMFCFPKSFLLIIPGSQDYIREH